MANGVSLASGIVEIATGPTGPTGPTGAAEPAGADTQIQYNDNGAMGASDRLTFDPAGPGDTAVLIVGGAFTITVGDNIDMAAADDAAGGRDINITAGDATSPASQGGKVVITGGDGNASSGEVTLQGGTGVAYGGGLYLYAGPATDVAGHGGNITISLGDGATDGDLILQRANVSNDTTACVFTADIGPVGAQTDIQGWLRIKIGGNVRFIPFW